MLPLPFITRTGRKASHTVKSGLFEDVDVVLFQELFRRFDGKDGLRDLIRRNGNKTLTGAVSETALRAGKFTDSGLAAVAVFPWVVTFVAFHEFPCAQYIDRFSAKGVCVFEINTYPRPLRVATTHLQASYSDSNVHGDEALRLRQFREAVTFAVRHGAVLLTGDVNTTSTPLLDSMHAIVDEVTNYKGVFLEHDDKPTCCKDVKTGVYYREKKRLDHAWILDRAAIRVTAEGVRTNDVVTNGYSDHACLEFTVIIQ